MRTDGNGYVGNPFRRSLHTELGLAEPIMGATDYDFVLSTDPRFSVSVIETVRASVK